MTQRNHDQRPRDGRGRWIRTQEGRQRDLLALEMRSAGRTWQTIADTLGYTDTGNAQRGVHTILAETTAPSVNEARAEMVAQLDHLYAEAVQVLEARHLKINNGELVHIPDEHGNPVPLEDDAPVLRAIDTINQLLTRKARLLGLDAPAKIHAEVAGVRVTIDGAEDV
jgi:hypothetical protein